MIPPIEQPLSESIDGAVGGQGDQTKAPAPAPHSIFQTIMMIGGTQIGAMAFGLLQSKIVAVTIGPKGVGVISMVDQVVALVAQVSTFSLPIAAVKFLSEAHSESREVFVRGYIAFLRALLLISFGGTTIAVALAVRWPSVLGTELGRYRSIVILALLAIPAMNLTALVTSTMAAARQPRAASLFGLFSAMTLAILSVIGILVGRLYGYYLADLVAVMVGVLASMIYLRWRVGLPFHGGRVHLLRELQRYPQALRLAGAMYVTSFTYPLAYLIARYTVLRAEGLGPAGLLQAAMGLGMALVAVLRSSNLLFLTPAVNRRGASQDKLHGAVEFLRALSIMIGILGLPLVLFPRLWLSLLYSREFVSAAPYICPFVLAAALQLLSGVNQSLVVGLDHIGIQVIASVAGEVGMGAICWSLVPYYGIGGVAAALLFNYLIVFILTAGYVWRKHRFSIHRAMGWLPFLVLLVIAAAGRISILVGADTWAFSLAKVVFYTLFVGLGVRYIWAQDLPFLLTARRVVESA